MEKNSFVLLDNAYKLHTSGKLDEAASIYEELLKSFPENPDILNLYAQLNVSLKNFDKAISLFNKVYELTKLDDIKINIVKSYIFKKDYVTALGLLSEMNCNDAGVASLSAYSAMQLNDYSLAAKQYKILTEIEPDNCANYYNLSLCYSYLDRCEEALKYALKAYNLNSVDIDILLHIASLYEKIDDKENAIVYLSKINDIQPNENILYRIGVLNKKMCKYPEAVSYFEKVLHINPDNKKAMLNIASSYRHINKKDALQIYQDIQTLYPEDKDITFLIYTMQQDMLDFDAAVVSALKLTEAYPEDSIYYSMVADAYMEIFDYEKAIEYYKLALKYNPDDESAKCSLAYAYSSHRDTDIAMDILSTLPRNSAVIQDVTILNLRKRNFKEVEDYYYNWHTKVHTEEEAAEKARKYFYKLNVGEQYGITEEVFTQFRAKLPAETLKKHRKYTEKLWHKEDVTGKNVLVYNGHGAGDLLMFVRYINILKEKAQHVILSVPDSLISLLKYSFPDVEVISSEIFVDEEKYDFSTPEMGLIYNLNGDFYNIPSSDKYLYIPKEEVEAKAVLDILNTKKKKVGLFWQGNPTTLRNRSVKLKYFKPLFDIDIVQLYSFQLSKVDFESHDLKQSLPLIDLSPYIKSYTDTAALLKNMDLLITIDTSIAHLAGGLGIKTFLLLPYDAEWRWFYDEERTPWYDSIRIFKQSNPKTWDDVIIRVKEELSKI